MRRLLLAVLPLSLLGACHKSSEEQVAPEYADWYALPAPEARAIEAVQGDIDGTLIITTRYKIFRTADRGNTWQQSDYKGVVGLTGFAQRRDTLLAMGAQLGGISDSISTTYATNGDYFSIDQGATWQRNQNGTQVNLQVPLNVVTSPAGTRYSVTVKQLYRPNSTTSWTTQTTGIKNATGRRFKLPLDHQIKSLYFDAKSRLYVAASAPVCAWGEQFAFCGAQTGVLYVSKNPLP